MFCFLIRFRYYRQSLCPCFRDNTTDVKTNENFLFLIPFPHKHRKSTYFVSEPIQYLHFRSFDIEVWKYIQYRRVGSAFYGNWNSFKNRYKWTSAEMFLRRFPAAFRTASIKNTHFLFYYLFIFFYSLYFNLALQ